MESRAFCDVHDRPQSSSRRTASGEEVTMRKLWGGGKGGFIEPTQALKAPHGSACNSPSAEPKAENIDALPRAQRREQHRSVNVRTTCAEREGGSNSTVRPGVALSCSLEGGPLNHEGEAFGGEQGNREISWKRTRQVRNDRAKHVCAGLCLCATSTRTTNDRQNFVSTVGNLGQTLTVF
ncbi:hypothetical protein BDN71DRAFT_1433129 [Pleurotus eryngii]|uniref:Uncharacterized protein n=1 Tax=Pleurotus eryngii TaxID=5323 RepID=A0A9P6DDY2_PLEER|nr:hypothetical protein BDN71DRAFT_1433129 [Pleurotus eryngii]